jgi:hypothetical protein
MPQPSREERGMRGSAVGEPLLIADGRMEAVNFPQHPLHNSIWAITAGDDGKIYPGLCCEIEAPLSAVLYQYDPKARSARFIYDLGELTDNPPSGGHMPHSKLHTSLCPAKDGKIYAATHNTAPPLGDPIWSMPACYHDRYRHYPGAHIVVYDPVADESRDLGMVVPFDTLYVMRIDRERERLFGVTMMTYQVVIYDIRSGRVRIHDPVGDAVSFGAFHDRWGNWYVCNERGRMIRWVADEDRFVPLHVELPPMRVEGKLWMSYGVTDAEGRLYGITGWDDPHLFRYDPHDGPEGRMDNPGPAWPDRAPDGPRGSRVRGLVFGAAAVSGLFQLRAQFVRWPLHPIGFTLAGSYAMFVLWSSFFLGWVVKVLVVRYGGLRTFVRLRPFFLGLVLGDCISGSLWAIPQHFTHVGSPIWPG